MVGYRMESFICFVTENATQIWTLVSVILGGLVTYISTATVEKRQNKRQFQKDNLEQVLIPYCTCLEETISNIERVYVKSAELYTEQGFQKWIDNLKEPLLYLNAAKRVFLSQSMRGKLEDFKSKVKYFETLIREEETICDMKYRKYVCDKLKDFSYVETFMYIRVSMEDEISNKIKMGILTKIDLSLFALISYVEFVHKDDDDNYGATLVCINKEIRDTLGLIEYGALDIDEVDNSEIKLSCNLLGFIHDNFADEGEILTNIIDSTQSAELMSELTDLVNDMKDGVLKIIDKITN